MRPYFAAEIRSRKKGLFATPLEPTGFLISFGMTSDAATDKCRTRHLHGGNMVIPDCTDTDSPIRSVSLGVDVLSTGKTGEKLVESIMER